MSSSINLELRDLVHLDNVESAVLFRIDGEVDGEVIDSAFRQEYSHKLLRTLRWCKENIKKIFLEMQTNDLYEVTYELNDFDVLFNTVDKVSVLVTIMTKEANVLLISVESKRKSMLIATCMGESILGMKKVVKKLSDKSKKHNLLFDYLFKISIVGNSNLLGLLEKNIIKNSEWMFHERNLPTIGVSFFVKDLEVGDKKTKTQIWLVSSNEKFSCVRSLYYEGLKGLIYVFDINDENALQSIDKDFKDYFEYYEKYPIWFWGIETDDSDEIDKYSSSSKEIVEVRKLKDCEISEFINEIEKTHENFTFFYSKIDKNSIKNISDVFNELIEELVRLES